jgi:hypothetical protein
MLSFLTGPAESSRVRGRASPLRFSASASEAYSRRHPPPPNNSFKPTPCRGVSRVLYATLAHVRRPATGRLNSGVRPLKTFVAPQTPEEMLLQLQELLPGFIRACEDEDEWPGHERSFHSVARDLAHFFPQQCSSLTDKQLRAFADWINGMVAASGYLENAISTCFLEHSAQLGVYILLSPHLSSLAKASARA